MIRTRICEPIDMYSNEEGKKVYYVEIDVDTADELNGLTEIGDMIIGHGSIAHVITTGDLYSYSFSTSSWYNQDGSDAPSPSVQTTQAAPLNMVSPAVLRPQTQLNTTPDNEPDDIEDIEEVTEDEPERGAESE